MLYNVYMDFAPLEIRVEANSVAEAEAIASKMRSSIQLMETTEIEESD